MSGIISPSIQHLFANFIKTVSSGASLFYKGNEMKLKESIDIISAAFPESSTSSLLKELPLSKNQHIFHTKMWCFLTKWDFDQEILMLECLKSDIQTETHSHIKTIKIFLKILKSFKTILIIAFTRKVNFDDQNSQLSCILDFFEQLQLKNSLNNTFTPICQFLKLARDFPHKPLGIYLDIVVAYLITFLINFFTIKTEKDFKNFMKFLKNKKFMNLLCPHLFLIACQFV